MIFGIHINTSVSLNFYLANTNLVCTYGLKPKWFSSPKSTFKLVHIPNQMTYNKKSLKLLIYGKNDHDI